MCTIQSGRLWRQALTDSVRHITSELRAAPSWSDGRRRLRSLPWGRSESASAPTPHRSLSTAYTRQARVVCAAGKRRSWVLPQAAQIGAPRNLAELPAGPRARSPPRRRHGPVLARLGLHEDPLDGQRVMRARAQ
eukprot:CAMPEP_0183399138 /NCGR_PEP_ID=MMETSP0370-20130417/11730_1 /TAXON_ID=268820 /ORGANISM="Peridinium aciculiferum, Strain PAER-2" /LENGTH=134 /DNA_ID=CAMNT_0025580249 /DNA_START=68 /DNA_END=470 /DNA_ORIENTATION=+